MKLNTLIMKNHIKENAGRLVRSCIVYIVLSGTSALADSSTLVVRSSQTPTNIVSQLQASHAAIEKEVAAIGAAVPAVEESLQKYQANPGQDTALELLKHEAVLASGASKACLKVAEETTRAAKACDTLAQEVGRTVEALRMAQRGAEATRTGLDNAAQQGLETLGGLQSRFQKEGVTNQAQLSPEMTRQVRKLLLRTGNAQLAARMAGAEVRLSTEVLDRLAVAAKNLRNKKADLEAVAEAFQSHSQTFQAAASSVENMSNLISLNSQYETEIVAVNALGRTIDNFDKLLAKTLGSFAAFDAGTLASPSSASDPGVGSLDVVDQVRIALSGTTPDAP